MADVQLNDQPNYLQMASSAYQAGRQQAQQKGIQNALSMNATDPAGAQAALIQFGAIPEANALAQNSAQQRSLAIRTKAGQQYATGDTQGALATASSGGDFDTFNAISKMTDEQRAQATHVADVTNSALFGLSQLPQEQRLAGLQKIAPTLVQQGVPQAMIDKAAQSGLSDDFLKASAASTMSVKEQIAAHQKDVELKTTADKNTAEMAMANTKFVETERHNRVDERNSGLNASANAQRAAMTGVQVLQDKDGTPYVYNVGQRTATTLDGKSYAPTGAQKLGSSSPRSVAALAAQKYLQENPNATAADLASFSADMGKKTAAAKAFGTGKQGQTVNALNVGIDHLNTIGDLTEALNNGNIPLFNKIAKDVAVATGKSAPTNFDAAKQIVAGEVVKAISGGGGGVHDREEAESAINRASSPAQLMGVIATQKKLFAGQLHGLRLQYKNSVGLDDFESHLTPEAARELEAIPIDAPAPASATTRPPIDSFFPGHK